MVSRRTVAALVVVGIAAVFGYRAASAPEPRAVAEVAAAEAFTCSAEYVGKTYAGPRPPRGTVPDSFVPVTVVVCDLDISGPVDADGTAAYFERRYTVDPAAVVSVVNAPSERRSLFPGACDTSSYSSPAPLDTWLLDTDGRAMEPWYPFTECGWENDYALSEVVSRSEVDVIEHRVGVDASALSNLFSCSSFMTTPSPAPGSKPLTELAWPPSGFCRFGTSGPDPQFVGADRYEATERDYSDGLYGLAPAGQCAERASTVLTMSTQSNAVGFEPVELHIELDGCRRIMADGYLPLQATRGFLANLDR
ncbi:MAG: hypothetical protein U5O16_41675 [Rhodococcus sp. (in: high G+C Gram-positive bacteria)]|uniref:hypothetical protein n=1 Tax=Rhodococcus sp. TaxID=1831 RepID=UPI002ADB39D2|nr:hypothetical protein [Rhodococcus sp. (in: high G+C Gram-positive bacteria)]